jgi:hypothetical protein
MLTKAVTAVGLIGWAAISGMDKKPNITQIAIGEYASMCEMSMKAAKNGPAITPKKANMRSTGLVETGTIVSAVQPENRQPRAVPGPTTSHR